MTAFRDELEGTGEAFTPSRLLDVRNRTRAALWEIADHIAPGLSEDGARAMAGGILTGHGLRRGWHKILVRFGTNTTKNFEEPSAPGVVLGDDDIFFIDIGPIYAGCEGDAGDTFVVGDEQEMARAEADVRVLWDQVRSQWADNEMTGTELYRFAKKQAMSMEWVLNLDLSGHRLSSFPHSAHYDGTLAEVDFAPSDLLWVLEIQIRHPERPFGAFFEDLLLYDDVLQHQSNRHLSRASGPGV
jgi:methionyl aminopeptidase